MIFGGGFVFISGWKSVSMVDVYGKVIFIFWFCGCNLKCFFCYNWLIVEGKECFFFDRGVFFGDLFLSFFFSGLFLYNWW